MSHLKEHTMTRDNFLEVFKYLFKHKEIDKSHLDKVVEGTGIKEDTIIEAVQELYILGFAEKININTKGRNDKTMPLIEKLRFNKEDLVEVAKLTKTGRLYYRGLHW